MHGLKETLGDTLGGTLGDSLGDSLGSTVASMMRICFLFLPFILFVLWGRLQGQRADVKGCGDERDQDA